MASHGYTPHHIGMLVRPPVQGCTKGHTVRKGREGIAMCHPLYPVASRMVGRSVIAHHMSGRTYPGYLQSVQHHGIYLLPHARRVGYETSDPSRLKLSTPSRTMSHLELSRFAPQRSWIRRADGTDTWCARVWWGLWIWLWISRILLINQEPQTQCKGMCLLRCIPFC